MRAKAKAVFLARVTLSYVGLMERPALKSGALVGFDKLKTEKLCQQKTLTI